MDLGLKGKVALVTGAGSQIGYGKGIALALARDGCDLIIADIDFNGAKKTAIDVKALGREAIAVKVDLTVSSEVDDMVKTGLEKFGRIDILVNNAGRFRPETSFVDTTEEHWRVNVDINLKGMWYCIRAVLPQMLKQKSGKIVNLSSGVARFGMPGACLYCAAKAGVIGLTRALAAEVGPLGINVNGIAPGMGDTGMLIDAGTSEGKEPFRSSVPMRRLTTPQDIGNMVVFLASDASIDIAGQTIGVDGGATRV
jgi:NAD(P)-dependent dehydrogenase (short-subunit alcohol dehydrogenase family)